MSGGSMKIIMPVAGKGSRLRPHTHSIPKALIRVAGEPIINHILAQLSEIENISEVIFIIGHLGNQIKDYVQYKHTFPMRFVKQKEYKGLGHAVYQAQRYFERDEDVLVLLGDIIFHADIENAIGQKTNILGVMEVEDPRKFGIVNVDKENSVTDMLEKPDNPTSNLAIAGIYYFKSSDKLFHAIDQIIKENITTKNEYQLTDAMKYMLESGEKFRIFKVDEWYDCGDKESLLETNQIVLEKLKLDYAIPGSIIIPPVFIGENVNIQNSVVGPNVSISHDSKVNNSIVKNSILGKGSTLENALIEHSFIGDNAYLHQSSLEFNIGPDSQIVQSR